MWKYFIIFMGWGRFNCSELHFLTPWPPRAPDAVRLFCVCQAPRLPDPIRHKAVFQKQSLASKKYISLASGNFQENCTQITPGVSVF